MPKSAVNFFLRTKIPSNNAIIPRRIEKGKGISNWEIILRKRKSISISSIFIVSLLNTEFSVWFSFRDYKNLPE